MRIGEYFILKNYITQDMLNEALEQQTSNKSLRIGEILVNMEALSEKELKVYVSEFFENNAETSRANAEEWLSQEQVDELFAIYGNVKES